MLRDIIVDIFNLSISVMCSYDNHSFVHSFNLTKIFMMALHSNEFPDVRHEKTSTLPRNSGFSYMVVTGAPWLSAPVIWLSQGD